MQSSTSLESIFNFASDDRLGQALLFRQKSLQSRQNNVTRKTTSLEETFCNSESTASTHFSHFVLEMKTMAGNTTQTQATVQNIVFKQENLCLLDQDQNFLCINYSHARGT